LLAKECILVEVNWLYDWEILYGMGKKLAGECGKKVEEGVIVVGCYMG
jgi:hypothetical protein